MSDLFGDVPESSPKELNGGHILRYLVISYLANLILLKTIFMDLDIDLKKALFMFSPVAIFFELIIIVITQILKLLDYIL